MKGIKTGKKFTIQFYYKDWLSDTRLQACSITTRGIWMELLCHMWADGESGELRATLPELQQLVRCTTAELQKFIAEVLEKGFCELHFEDDFEVEMDHFNAAQNGFKTAHSDFNAAHSDFKKFSFGCHAKISHFHGHVTLICRRLQREAKVRNEWVKRKRRQRVREMSRPKSRPSHAVSSLSLSTPRRSKTIVHFAAEIAKLYNELLSPPLPPVRVSSERLVAKSLEDQLKFRVRQSPELQALGWWQDFFESILDMPFLLGDNDRGWTANLHWITRRRNLEKILDGNYRRAPPRSRPMTPDEARKADIQKQHEFIIALAEREEPKNAKPQPTGRNQRRLDAPQRGQQPEQDEPGS